MLTETSCMLLMCQHGRAPSNNLVTTPHYNKDFDGFLAVLIFLVVTQDLTYDLVGLLISISMYNCIIILMNLFVEYLGQM